MTLSWDELEQIRGKKDWRIPIPPTCPNCSYILTGLPGNRCPECGCIFNWSKVRRRAGRVWSAVNALRHANRDAMAGLQIVSGGWVLMAPVIFFKLGLMSCLLRVIIGLAALLGMVLGSQVLSIRQVPAWARVYVEGPPTKVFVGLVTVLLSLTLVVAVFIL